jgi:hypothetical protein
MATGTGLNCQRVRPEKTQASLAIFKPLISDLFVTGLPSTKGPMLN